MAKYPAYSADSITYRLLAGYGKIILPDTGELVAMTSKNRRNRDKNAANFVDACKHQHDDSRLKYLEKQVKAANMTFDELKDSSHARAAFNLRSIQHLVKTKFAYKESNLARPKMLFEL